MTNWSSIAYCSLYPPKTWCRSHHPSLYHPSIMTATHPTAADYYTQNNPFHSKTGKQHSPWLEEAHHWFIDDSSSPLPSHLRPTRKSKPLLALTKCLLICLMPIEITPLTTRCPFTSSLVPWTKVWRTRFQTLYQKLVIQVILRCLQNVHVWRSWTLF